VAEFADFDLYVRDENIAIAVYVDHCGRFVHAFAGRRIE
jgi:hypothetical protein